MYHLFLVSQPSSMIQHIDCRTRCDSQSVSQIHCLVQVVGHLYCQAVVA